LQSGERHSAADRTDARFDSRTNTLIDLIQAGNFEFKEKGLSGKAQNARVEESGNMITLAGSSYLSDSDIRIEANEIRLDQRNNSVTAAKDVKTMTTSGDERVFVMSQRAERRGDRIVHSGAVELFRGAVYIKAEQLELLTKDNRLRAAGGVESVMGSLHTWSDRLDYDDHRRTAHYDSEGS
jgi:lipopolysaccharide assembly outer membrane protein LptD (OstA)